MKELEITWKRVASVWWLIVWRGLVGGWILAIVIAFVVGETGGRLQIPFPTVAAVGTALAWLAALAWCLFVMKMALKKHYQEFRLVLVKKS